MSNKQIILAEEFGYCWGVRRALEIITTKGSAGNPVATIGDVIHNPQVVERLRSRGVDTAETIEEAQSRGFQRVATTAHGAGPERATLAAERGVELVDTTCPLVTKVQRLGEKLARQGYFLIVYGDSFHPEVRGILSWSGTSRAVSAKHLSDLPWTAGRGSGAPADQIPPRKVAVVSQTTKNVAEFLEFINELTPWVARDGGELRVCNTICEPTTERQNALHKLAREVDLILAIGGKKSSNTARLAEVGRSYGKASYHIESEAEIAPEWLEGIEKVGITAGASTPDDVVESVIRYLQGQGFAGPEGGMPSRDLEIVPLY